MERKIVLKRCNVVKKRGVGCSRKMTCFHVDGEPAEHRMSSKMMCFVMDFSKLARKMCQGGGPEALENHVAKKDAHPGKKGCHF